MTETFFEQLDISRLEQETDPAEPPPAGLISFFEHRLGIVPHGKQRDVLACQSKRVIVNCSRQWGKSTLAAGKALHTAASKPRSLVLVASPTERQSAEFLSKVKSLAASAGIRAVGDGHNRVSLRLPNGARIVGLPGNEGTVRGFSAVSLLLIDEASRVTDEMYRALRPMLAVSGGDLWMMSTPMGRRGFFFDTWEFGDDWAKFISPVTENPRISPEFVEEERAVQGETWFRQEYMCEFIDNGTEVFGRELVEAALDDDCEMWPLRQKTSGWVMPLARGRVSIGVDLGKRQDHTAIAVVERRPGKSELVVRYLERMPLGTGFALVRDRVQELGADLRLGSQRHIVVDATGLGSPFVDMVRPGLKCSMTAVTLTGGSRQRGVAEWWYVPKAHLLTLLQVVLECMDLRIARELPESSLLVKELTCMRPQGDGRGGEHDDMAMALALACWGLKKGEAGYMGDPP